jgi:hypothetical protein
MYSYKLTYVLSPLLGHWILNVFPQCKGDLKELADAEFPLYESPSATLSDLEGIGCNPCVMDD